MPHAQKVIEFLKYQNIRLIACFRDKADPAASLEAIGLDSLFTTNGVLQAVSASQETDRSKELNLKPLTYYHALKALGIDSIPSVVAITGHFDEIKEARASGLKQIIGFYGAPSIPLEQVSAAKDALERDVAALAGTKLTTPNLREVPHLLGYR